MRGAAVSPDTGRQLRAGDLEDTEHPEERARKRLHDLDVVAEAGAARGP